MGLGRAAAMILAAGWLAAAARADPPDAPAPRAADAAAPRAVAADAPAPRAGPPSCHALLVGAMPGGELYARRYREWLTRFQAYLTRQAGVPAAQVTVLSGDKEFRDPIVAGLATAESVRAALAALAAKVRPEDQVLLVLVGHGVVTDRSPTLVLPGPDVTAADLADGLGALAARNQVVVNLSSSSGAAVAALAAPGRVLVAATGPTEGNEPVFPEFFLRGLESKRADGEGAPAAGARDGLVTVLEAYNWAAREAALWISRLRSVAGEGWRIDGKESVEIFEKLYGSGAGGRSPFPLAPSSDRAAPDAPVAIGPEGGKLDASWTSRRVLSEHAMLEDCGKKEGVSAVGKEGYEPLAGTREGEPGWLARRVVLGRPDLLPPAAPDAGAKP